MDGTSKGCAPGRAGVSGSAAGANSAVADGNAGASRVQYTGEAGQGDQFSTIVGSASDRTLGNAQSIFIAAMWLFALALGAALIIRWFRWGSTLKGQPFRPVYHIGDPACNDIDLVKRPDLSREYSREFTRLNRWEEGGEWAGSQAGEKRFKSER